jgi:hypothetical protein
MKHLAYRTFDVLAVGVTFAQAGRRSLMISLIALVSIVFSLPWLKMAQVEREVHACAQKEFRNPAAAKNPETTYVDAYCRARHNNALITLYALNRRADDPSFWFALTLMLATIYALNASNLLAILSLPAQQRWRRLPLLVFFALLFGYLLLTWLAKEALFQGRSGNTDSTVLLIQRIEGVMMIVAILCGTRTFGACLTLTDAATELLRRSGLHESLASRMTWSLIMASYGSLVALISGIAICQALDLLSRAFGPFDGIRKFLLFVQLIPFLFAGMYVKYRLGRRFVIDRVSALPHQVPTLITILTAGSVVLTRLQKWTQSGLMALLIAIVNVLFIYRVRIRPKLLRGYHTQQVFGPWIERWAFRLAGRTIVNCRLWRC